MRQGDLSVTNYFTELKIMWDELENFRPVPKCSCEIPCTCDALIGVRNHRTEDRRQRIFRGSSSSNKASWSKNGKYYTHCKKQGHTMDICYRLHGFSANFKFTKNPHANSATTSDSYQRRVDPLIGFNEEEFRRLQNMPSQPRINNDQNNSTILSTVAPDMNENSEEDSGVTDHISCCLSLYSCYYRIKPIRVILPNGHTIIASISGIIPPSK
ncbi:hypothetical protein Lal_00038558 [Lupinus albus]|nr:hypothetical protein Lal_00038558 [Lupinus albus]